MKKRGNVQNQENVNANQDDTTNEAMSGLLLDRLYSAGGHDHSGQ